MLDAALSALAVFASPTRLALLCAGVVAGFLVGILPGLGGIVAVSVLLPFILRLDAQSALAMLTGSLAVVYTSDTITSVLVGTPGSPAAAPTAIEGHALAKHGQAARALTAAFLSSLVGGFVGVIGLTLSIPIARPLVMLLGSPELFMFTALGVAYGGSLLGRSAVRGLLSGLLGILLGLIGPAPAAAEFRYTFGQVYLLDGLSLVVLALGVFGVTEMVSLLGRGGAIARDVNLGSGWVQGVRDVLEHRWVLLRGALIGMWAGILPAIGATAGAWMSYGHVVATSRDRSRFGRGEIRGIIAPESANNAAAAGDLIPTLLFSVPGGPAAAVILGAMYTFGIFPGPRLVQDQLDIVYVIVWSFALANILGAILCFLASPLLARVTYLPFAVVAPPLLTMMVLGAFQTTRHGGDLVALLMLGVLGWAMKRSGWPRAPLLIGFVLARPMERYFWLTVKLHGWRWITYPGVLVIGALMIAPFLVGIIRWMRRKRSGEQSAAMTPSTGSRSLVPMVTAIAAFVLFAYALLAGLRFHYDARLMPLLATVPAVVLSAVQARRSWRGEPGGSGEEDEEGGAAEPGQDRQDLRQFGLIGGYLILVWLIGFHIATVLFFLVTLRLLARMRWTALAAYTAFALVGFYLLGRLFLLRWPVGVLMR